MRKQKISLKYYLSILRHVTILNDSRIYSNESKYVFKDLNDITPSDDWFQYEYIDAEVNNKLDKTKGRLAGNEMENETKHYV